MRNRKTFYRFFRSGTQPAGGACSSTPKRCLRAQLAAAVKFAASLLVVVFYGTLTSQDWRRHDTHMHTHTDDTAMTGAELGSACKQVEQVGKHWPLEIIFAFEQEYLHLLPRRSLNGDPNSSFG